MSNEENDRKSTGSSRLGKEAKIGVTVIAVLLIAFGVVAAMRFGGSSLDDKLASATDRDDGQSKTGAMLKDAKPKLFGGGSPPTIVPVKAVPARLSKTTTGDPNPWKLASDRGESNRTGGGAALSAPPSFMPDSPKPSHANRRDRYALNPPAGKDVDDAGPPREVDNDARLVAPGDEASSRSGVRIIGDNASAGIPPAPLPHRESSRYGTPTPPQPPALLHAGPSYSGSMERSTPTMPVAQYGTDDYRRESTGFRRNSGEPRRSTAASLYNNPPPRRDDGKYEVQPNDSYWTISERLYGTGAYFKALAQHNRGKGADEDRLQPGALILAPTVAQLEQSYPDLCPKPSRREALQSQNQSRASAVSTRNQYRGGRTYTVVEGDTLFNIARYELGKASRWAEIYDLNRDMLGKDFNYLTPGTQLAMPEGEKSDVLAQPPGNMYRR